MGSLSESDGSFAPKMAPEDALAAGGTLYSLLGIVRSPLASVLMAWIVSNFISSSVICDVVSQQKTTFPIHLFVNTHSHSNDYDI